MALTTSRVTIRGDFEPLAGSVYHADYPFCYRATGGSHPIEACTCDWETRLETLFAQVVDPRKVAAIFIEPVIGEGGYIVPPAGFLPRLREIADRHGILLVADEVQSGFGRTGRFWAIEHWDVVPDIIVMAKGIASGLPLSGILAPRELLAAWAPGRARRHLRRQRRELRRGQRHAGRHRARGPRGERGRARPAAARRPARGRRQAPRWATSAAWAAWSGIEFVDPDGGRPRTPDPGMVKRVVAGALDRKLILLTCGSFGQVVRLIPPLVTTADEVDQAVAIIDASIDRRRSLTRRGRVGCRPTSLDLHGFAHGNGRRPVGRSADTQAPLRRRRGLEDEEGVDVHALGAGHVAQMSRSW